MEDSTVRRVFALHQVTLVSLHSVPKYCQESSLSRVTCPLGIIMCGPKTKPTFPKKFYLVGPSIIVLRGCPYWCWRVCHMQCLVWSSGWIWVTTGTSHALFQLWVLQASAGVAVESWR